MTEKIKVINLSNLITYEIYEDELEERNRNSKGGVYPINNEKEIELFNKMVDAYVYSDNEDEAKIIKEEKIKILKELKLWIKK